MKTTSVGLLVVGFLAVGGISYHLGQKSAMTLPSATKAAQAPEDSEASLTLPALAHRAQPGEIVEELIDPSAAPVTMQPEFGSLLINNINVRTWHAKLEKQPRDHVWAAETEETYRRFFLGDTNFAKFGVTPEVDCRTSICEVRLITYAAEKGMKWHQVLDKATYEGDSPPPKAFPGIVAWDEQDGVTAVYYLMMFQNRPDPNKDFVRGFSQNP